MLTLQIKIQTMKCEYSDQRAVMAKFRRSFGEGVGSIVSLRGGNIKLPLGTMRTDTERLRGDWEAVGQELRKAYESENDTMSHSSNYGKTDKRAE